MSIEERDMSNIEKEFKKAVFGDPDILLKGEISSFTSYLLDRQDEVVQFWNKFKDQLDLNDIATFLSNAGVSDTNAFRYAYRFMLNVCPDCRVELDSMRGKHFSPYKHFPQLKSNTSLPPDIYEMYSQLSDKTRIKYEELASLLYTIFKYHKDELLILTEEEKYVVSFFEKLFNITPPKERATPFLSNNDAEKILKLNKYSENTIQEYRYPLRQKLIERFKNYTGWVITFSDLHVPYINWEIVLTALNSLKQFPGNKLLVLGGDILDFDQFSSWGGRKRIVDVPYDIIATAKFLDAIYHLFDNIIIIEGNHERRLYNYLFKYLDKNAPYMLDFINVPELIKRYLSSEAQKKVIFSPDWYAIIGEMIVAHNNKASVIKGKSVSQTIDYFIENLKDTKISAVMQAHTHTQVKLKHQGVWGLETGMLGKDPSYRAIKSSRIKPLYGYGYGQLISGKLVDPNRFNFVYLGEDYIDYMMYPHKNNEMIVEGEVMDSQEAWENLFTLFGNLF